MWPYWILFTFSVLAALNETEGRKYKNVMPWLVTGVLLCLIIGLRHQVGGDWWSYIFHYNLAEDISLYAAIEEGKDAGYTLLNWMSARLNMDIYAVNLISSAIFVAGLIVFCRHQPNPWLALMISIPYLVIVVSMGYTRQSVALGLLLLALVALEKDKFIKFLLYLIIAVAFHRTAIIMIAFGALLRQKHWSLKVLAVAMTSYGLWDAFVSEDMRQLWSTYVEDEMHSEGAKVRVLMNFVPALILLMFWAKWKRVFHNHELWFWMSILSIICVFIVSYATTAVDRIALYVIPLQIVVFSRLPYLFRKSIKPRSMVMTLILGYALVLYVWLNYASHAYLWLPYQNALFV